MKKKLVDHVNYGITKSQVNFQIAMMDTMNKLVNEIRENNVLLKQVFFGQKQSSTFQTKQPQFRIQSSIGVRRNMNSSSSNRIDSTYQTAYPRRIFAEDRVQKDMKEKSQEQFSPQKQQIKKSHIEQSLYDLQKNMQIITQTNKILLNKFEQRNSKDLQNKAGEIFTKNNGQKISEGQIGSLINDLVNQNLNGNRKQNSKSYGILSQIMPFSDKREIKVKFRITDLIAKISDNGIDFSELKIKTTEWLGLVYRATASICWNMLLNGFLNFEEVKVLFTENIIYNFIQFMNEIELIVDEEKRYELTQHINNVSVNILQFLCQQYPQTKIQAPNIALRNSIPLIENQRQVKFDLISLISINNLNNATGQQSVTFQFRQDKDYTSVIMKSINYMIEQTDLQFDQFQMFMSNIFDQIFVPFEKRRINFSNMKQSVLIESKNDLQYRQKVKQNSGYQIGRKIPKNTPKYKSNQIQYGVFFVKSVSILRIITKWVEQLWQFVIKAEENISKQTFEHKSHNGKVLNISNKLRKLIMKKVSNKKQKIKTKIERIKMECYYMELLLTKRHFTNDQDQVHLSHDQVIVGKYCSNLKNAISSYVSAQLSKIIYYLLLIPRQIDESELNLNDEDLEEQARKHLDNINLVTLKIFDLLRCKCHASEQNIIWIVETLKALDRDDPKFELVRVKDRLNQGTRDILINAQYNNGLVWEIQLSVTSTIDKKQDLLDKYNHFLYELKRASLGPLSENVSIWATLEQRSSYFEKLRQKQYKNKYKQGQSIKWEITHKKTTCSNDDLKDFSQFKRPTICVICNQYYSIPQTSLLNVRCQKCRITYCGQCFYYNLSTLEKKRFIFQNFDKQKLLITEAFHKLTEFSDYKKSFPKEGFFIKKKFLNRQLSYFTVSQIDLDQSNDNSVVEICLTQTVVRDSVIENRIINEKSMKVCKKNGDYYLIGDNPELRDLIIFYFEGINPVQVTIKELGTQMKPADKNIKILNVLEEPNFTNELHLYKKTFQKTKLLNKIHEIQNIENFKISIYKFSHLIVLAKINIDDKRLKEQLLKKQNRNKLKKIIGKKITIINLQQCQISNEFQYIISSKNQQNLIYFQKVQKLSLAFNNIANIEWISVFPNLQSLSISKNLLKSLHGIENLNKLSYLKFDDNHINSLVEVSNLTELTFISGNNNQIASLTGLERLFKLQSLALSANQIIKINELEHLIQLKRSVIIGENKIKDLSPLKYSKVSKLYISDSMIDPLELINFKSEYMEELALRHLNLQSIPNIFDKMTNLLELKLSKNKIKKIEHLQSLDQLTLLDLNQNLIEKMENLQKLINLQIVKLANNKITSIDCVKSFIQCLKVLDLRQNPINDLRHFLIYEQKATLRVKLTQQKLTEKAKQQRRDHITEIGSKSESDG